MMLEDLPIEFHPDAEEELEKPAASGPSARVCVSVLEAA